MSKKANINSCPFCGGCNCELERKANTIINGRAFFAVKCGLCGASGPVFDEERAVVEWNDLSVRIIPSFSTNNYREFLSNEWLEWIGKGKINDRR